MRRTIGLKLTSLAAILVALCVAAFSPTAYASAPGPNGNPSSTGAPSGNWQYTPPSAQWVALKNAGRIRSGITPGEPKGTPSHPFVAPDTQGGAPPPSYELSISSYVNSAYEPSDGNNPNFGSGTSHNDDAGHSYNDHDFFDLWGPGAADNALWYWPNPPNLLTSTVTDTAHTSTTTYWSSERMRGYMTHLAWQIQWPNWPHKGMMDNSTYPTYGVTLYGMADGLNWEASGENSSTWSNYFYYIQWWNQSSAGNFHNDVTSDIYNSTVPVVAEVDASLMPNWPPSPNNIHHYITIVGYNDYNGTYQYTDTCGNTTGCGSLHDAGVQTVSQSQMWNAITAIPVNTSTAPSAGDGGWVW